MCKQRTGQLPASFWPQTRLYYCTYDLISTLPLRNGPDEGLWPGWVESCWRSHLEALLFFLSGQEPGHHYPMCLWPQLRAHIFRPSLDKEEKSMGAPQARRPGQPGFCTPLDRGGRETLQGGAPLTISGLQTVCEPQSQVAFGLEFWRFLSHINDSFGKLLSLFQLQNKKKKKKSQPVKFLTSVPISTCY